MSTAKKTAPKDPLPIRFDEFVSKIVSDPLKSEPLILVSGFIGSSSEKDHVRIYSSITLDKFIDVPVDGIVYTKEMSPEQSPSGGSFVWLKKDTSYLYGNPADTTRPRAKFLDGDIYSAYAKNSGRHQRPHPTIPCETNADACPRSISNCPVHYGPPTYYCGATSNDGGQTSSDCGDTSDGGQGPDFGDNFRYPVSTQVSCGPTLVCHTSSLECFDRHTTNYFVCGPTSPYANIPRANYGRFNPYVGYRGRK